MDAVTIAKLALAGVIALGLWMSMKPLQHFGSKTGGDGSKDKPKNQTSYRDTSHDYRD